MPISEMRLFLPSEHHLLAESQTVDLALFPGLRPDFISPFLHGCEEVKSGRRPGNEATVDLYEVVLWNSIFLVNLNLLISNC